MAHNERVPGQDSIFFVSLTATRSIV